MKPAQAIHTAEIEVLDDPVETDPLARENVKNPTVPSGPDPTELNIDIEGFIEDMELGEIELIEEAIGLSISAILRQFETQDYSAKVLIALVWLAIRRDDPAATMDTARKVKLVQIAAVDDDDDDENPL